MTQSRIRITQMGVAILVALSVGAPWAFSSEDCDLCEEAFEMEAEECMDNYDTSHCDAEENLARRYQCYREEWQLLKSCMADAYENQEACENVFCYGDDICMLAPPNLGFSTGSELEVLDKRRASEGSSMRITS